MLKLIEAGQVTTALVCVCVCVCVSMYTNVSVNKTESVCIGSRAQQLRFNCIIYKHTVAKISFGTM